MIFPSSPRIGLLELGLGLGAVVLPVWLALGVWALRDMRRRSRSGWRAVAVLLLVLLLPIVGLIVYLLLRPRETLMQRYDRTLQQEALLQQIEASHSCPGCARPVEAHWLVCPECYTSLRRPCAHCEMALEMHWQICPNCARVVVQPESLSQTDESQSLMESPIVPLTTVTTDKG